MLGGRMVWVGMSRGRFVGGRNVKVPELTYVVQNDAVLVTTYPVHSQPEEKNVFILL
jgi:hypothetical protein